MKERTIKLQYLFFLFFILWPFGALVFSIKYFRRSWFKNVVWFFVGYSGYTFVISNETMDSNRYRESFEMISRLDSTFANFALLVFNSETKFVDILQPVISFIVSRFTDDYKILFLIFGIIFGFFYSRNLSILLRQTSKITKTILPLVIVFPFVIGFWEINGFRFWTASQIFLYAVLKFYLDGNKKSLLLFVVAVLMHYTFIFPILIFIFSRIIKVGLGLALSIYFLCYLTSIISPDFFSNIVNAIVPGVFSEKADFYTDAGYAKEVSNSIQSLNWYVKYYYVCLQVVLQGIFIAIIASNYLLIRSHKFLNDFMIFIILSFAFFTAFSVIPAMGRFIAIGDLLIIAFSVSILGKAESRKKYASSISMLGIPLIAFFIIMSVRISFDTIGVMTIIGNPMISTFLLQKDLALIQLISGS